ncbi:Diguanylate cyclase, GGDEF domain [Pseudobutyrivibrio sp. OR37]|uniref:diguanylate cyclase domain-containing protein n=1 Tax=Pseudobutyrivibrio sp. OR37 TaxID=1798186 RepID=UPI0008DEF9CA|nr:diguanylate cyclase [Pseudobutyrivibrio sp. OR37]SFI30608.1 Diguanylate cyclase, GGDEF domain [Pseudobutyrivibrio sp. OR37]
MSSYIEEDINLKGYFDCLPMVVLLGYIDNQAELQHLEELERIKHERKAYARLAALTGDYICMYSINPETNAFTEYDSAEKYSRLHIVKQGNDFFKQPFKDGAELIYAGDREMFKSLFCKAEVMKQIAQKGIYILEYRAMIEDRTHYVRLKVAMVSEFAIALFDINNLKYVNDTYGHKAGDEMYKNKKQLKNKK